jgi:NADH-quinone oxidoreductase subunit L
VYMIGRNAVLFSHAPQTLAIVAIIGAATALIAGTIGLVQNDIKRVLAYSTVSQLGYMFLAMGVGAFASGIFHLYTHAFFKALLFLGSGAVIHALGGEQDMRRMGGLKNALPITYWTFVIGAVAISGVPGFAGFFSKDEILARTFASGHRLLWVVGLFTALLTAIYMFRVVFLTFHGPRAPEPARPEHPEEEEPAAHASHQPHGVHLHDAPPAMAFALVALAIGSVVAGYAGIGGRFEHFLAPSFGVETGDVVFEGVSEGVLTGASIVTAILGILIAAWYFLQHRASADALARRFSGVHRLLTNKYYVDEIYDAAVVQPIHIVSEDGLWQIVDVKMIDGAVNGVGDTVGGGSAILRRLQTGSVRAYAASLFAGVVLILGFYLWR